MQHIPSWIDAIDVAAVLVDGQARVVQFNRAAGRVLGDRRRVEAAVDAIPGIARAVESLVRGEGASSRTLTGPSVPEGRFLARIEVVGPSRALVRFSLDPTAAEEDEDDEPTADVVHLDHAGRPRRDWRVGQAPGVLSYQARPAAPPASEADRPRRSSEVPRSSGPPARPPEERPRPLVELEVVHLDADEEPDEPTVVMSGKRVKDRIAAHRLPSEVRGRGVPAVLVRDGRIADCAEAVDPRPEVRRRVRELPAEELVRGQDGGPCWTALTTMAAEWGSAERPGIVRLGDEELPAQVKVRRGVASGLWVVEWRALGPARRRDDAVETVDVRPLPHAAGSVAAALAEAPPPPVVADPGGAQEEDLVPARLALALARSVRPLLVRDDIGQAIDEALALVGSAVRADRCFLVLVEPEPDAEGRVHASQRYAWAAEGTEALPEAARIPSPGRGVVPPRWVKMLAAGGKLSGPAASFPESERAILERYGVRSVVVVPVRDEGRLLGFLGLDACVAGRDWTTPEIEILRGIGDGFAGAFRRRDVAATLRRGRDRVEAAVRGAALALWEVDATTGRLLHLDGVERHLGLRTDQLPDSAQGFVELVLPEDRERLATAVGTHLEGRTERVDVEVRVAVPGRGARWVQLRGRITQRDSAGVATRAHGTLQDIDERTRLLGELEEARAQAERASDLKSRFLANMSHELRTPLNAVLGCASLLQGTGLSHQQDDLVETLRGSGEHLLSLLEQILDVSRIESGELELVAQPFDLHALLLGIRDLFRPLAANRQLALEVRLDEGVPVQVVGDPLRVRQVLVNLVDNAVKFTDVGSITVRASCPDPADPGWVRVEVVDTGIGVGTDEVEALFDTFSQGEDSDARRYGGSGLGLAISSRLCRLMGGRLEVDSEPGRGSTFHFDVRLEPAEDTSPMAPAVAETEPVRLPSDLGILVVEDNLVNQKVVVGMLERLGCKAAVASGGAEALRAVEASPPDLVLMDLQMPGMDGLEATRRIRREFASVLHPWIIAVTAAAQAEDRRRSLDAGMNDYLAKPVRLVELRRALERGVEAMQQAGELAVHRG